MCAFNWILISAIYLAYYLFHFAYENIREDKKDYKEVLYYNCNIPYFKNGIGSYCKSVRLCLCCSLTHGKVSKK